MKQENKGIVIIIYLIMLVIAIGGPIIALKEETNVHILEDYEDDYEYENEHEEEPEAEEDEEDYQTTLDTYLNKYTFTVTTTDREKLINSTNLRNCMSDEIYGEMFNETISDNFKLVYTANELVRFIGKKEEAAIVGTVTIKESTLLENARKIFANVEIPSTFDTDLFYFGTYKLSCTQGICTFTQDTFGITGITPIDGYETKITMEENNLVVKKIYVDEEMIDFNNETNIYKFNAKLYDKHNGTLIETIEDYEIDLSQDTNVYDEFSPYYEEIDTYTYKFDSNNRLISVAKNR